MNRVVARDNEDLPVSAVALGEGYTVEIDMETENNLEGGSGIGDSANYTRLCVRFVDGQWRVRSCSGGTGVRRSVWVDAL